MNLQQRINKLESRQPTQPAAQPDTQFEPFTVEYLRSLPIVELQRLHRELIKAPAGCAPVNPAEVQALSQLPIEELDRRINELLGDMGFTS